MEQEEELLFDLEDNLSSTDDSFDNISQYSAPPAEYLVQSKKHAEELAELKAKQAKLDIERSEQENLRILHQFDSRFPNMSDEEKAYIRGFMQINNQILEKQLADRDAKIEALSNRIYQNELNSDNIKSALNNIDYRTTMHEVCTIALNEKFKGKLKNGVRQAEIDFALSEYELRLQNDEKFALKVRSITSDPKLKPSQIKSKLATLVADNTVKSYVEKYKKSGNTKVEVEVADKSSKKEENQKPNTRIPEAPNSENEESPLTKEQYDRTLKNILKNL